MSKPYVVKHTVPVYVFVDPDTGVYRVVVDDDSLSEPIAFITPEDVWNGWLEENERPITKEQEAAYSKDQERTGDWPGWDFGF